MKEYLDVLKKAKLFNGISGEEILSAANCLNAKIKAFNKNSIIFREGENADFTGIVLSGEVQIQKTDYAGNINIISNLYPSDAIALSVCCSTDKRLPFNAICLSECEIFCLDISRIISPCQKSCPFHLNILHNVLNLIADRNNFLAGKIEILTKRTIREKTLAYLYTHAKGIKNKRFSVPLSRRQMAEYLSVDRSALSRELGNLSREGLIDFDNNSFVIKDNAQFEN